MTSPVIYRAGRGPARNAGAAFNPRGGRAATQPGLSGPAPRFRLIGAEYMGQRDAFRSRLHEAWGARTAARQARSDNRAALSAFTGGKLSTGRSHRQFRRAMINLMRANQGLDAPEGAAKPFHSSGRSRPTSLQGGMDAYFAKRATRHASYEAQHGQASSRLPPSPPLVGDEGGDGA